MPETVVDVVTKVPRLVVETTDFWIIIEHTSEGLEVKVHRCVDGNQQLPHGYLAGTNYLLMPEKK